MLPKEYSEEMNFFFLLNTEFCVPTCYCPFGYLVLCEMIHVIDALLVLVCSSV